MKKEDSRNQAPETGCRLFRPLYAYE